MKLKNMKISRQTNLTLIVILLMIIILSTYTLFSINSLWNHTAGIYEHPLTVTQAADKIESDIILVEVNMHHLLISEDAQEADMIIAEINSLETHIAEQISIIESRYLGPIEDIDNIHEAIIAWNTKRAENIDLINEGRLDEALVGIESNGIDGQKAEEILTLIAVVKDFAQSKADSYYAAALEEKNRTFVISIALIGIMAVIFAWIGQLLKREIVPPLNKLTDMTDRLQQGDLTARSDYKSGNEFGELTDAFNMMADALETDAHFKEDIATLSAVMLRSESLEDFANDVLENIMKLTGSFTGAFYLLNDDKSSYIPFTSIGLKQDKLSSFLVMNREGEFGVALGKGQLQHISDIPINTQMIFSTVSGDFLPKDIITLPVLMDNEVIAIISLSSMKGYTESTTQLLNSVQNELAARLNGLLAAKKIIEFSNDLQKSNDGLNEQAKELAMQSRELTEQNRELEMQKKQLDEAAQLKNTFLSNMSHELRTPLNSVIALASVLHNRLEGRIPDEEHGYLDVIERNGKNLLALVNDLLDLSKIESGKQEVFTEQFNMGLLIHETVELLAPQAERKGIELINEVGLDIEPIQSDKEKCRHILENIIGNAVKFTEEGTVKISVDISEERLNILVTDTGIGIADDHLEMIFDEFRQADESSSRTNGGTGLGLAIAKKYAQMIDATIDVESIEGKGSVFTFSVPFSNESLQEAKKEYATVFARKHKMGSAIGTTLQKTLLLVDDSEPAIIQTTDILKENGYKVLIARNGQEAIELLNFNRPDGVILDLMMPVMDGFETLKNIRSIEKNAKIPILILTAKHITKDELSFLKSNHVAELIQKGSIEKDQLLGAVYDLVKNEDNDFPSENKPKILYIDDNPDNRLSFSALFKDQYIVIEAADGKSGLKKAIENMPDVILTDLALPGMDGFKVLDEKKKLKRLNHIPVVAVSAIKMNTNESDVLDYGFDGYIAKPIDTAELDKIIKGLLDENQKL